MKLTVIGLAALGLSSVIAGSGCWHPTGRAVAAPAAAPVAQQTGCDHAQSVIMKTIADFDIDDRARMGFVGWDHAEVPRVMILDSGGRFLDGMPLSVARDAWPLGIRWAGGNIGWAVLAMERASRQTSVHRIDLDH